MISRNKRTDSKCWRLTDLSRAGLNGLAPFHIAGARGGYLVRAGLFPHTLKMGAKRILRRIGLFRDLPSLPQVPAKPLLPQEPVKHFSGNGVGYDLRNSEEDPGKAVQHPEFDQISSDRSRLLTQVEMDALVDVAKRHDKGSGECKKSPLVLDQDDQRSIKVTGESHFTDSFNFLREKYQDPNLETEISNWFTGVLLAEENNPFDRNAVSVLLIDREGARSGEYRAFQVGYVAKELAGHIQPQILSFRDKGKMTPLLIRLHGGTNLKPNFGVVALVLTSKIKF